MTVDGVELWFNNNRTFEERKRDKALGRIKYNLIELKGFNVQDVRINWKTGIVKVKNKGEVAAVCEDATVQWAPDFEDVQLEVERGMKEWIDKRSRDE